MTPKQKTILLFITIGVVVFIAFLPSLFCDFTNFDDDWMLTNNDLVRQLSFKHIARNIFGRIYYGVYQPTVFLSYAIEYHFFGLNPFVYHLDNVILHILNTWLVFILINHLSGNKNAALLACLFWSLNPLRVESVTWVTERKDLLYSFFYIFSLIKYIQYIKSGNKKSHLFLSLLFFTLSCLSKLTAVSLSFIIILLDYYYYRKPGLKVIFEKIFYFGISFVFGVLAIAAVRLNEGGKMPTSFFYSGTERLQLISSSFVNYLAKSIVPYHLSAFHPYIYQPGSLPGYYKLFLLSAIFITIIAIWLFFRYKSRKLVFGLMFFLAAVIFALQFLPVGDAAFADRNIYISSIGIAFLFGELYLLLLKKFSEKILLGAAATIFLIYGIATHQQTKIWKNSISLFTNVIEKYPESYLGYLNRGVARYSQRDFAGALEDYEKSLERRPIYNKTLLNRALIYEEFNQNDSALLSYNEAIRISPLYGKAYLGRGGLFHKMKKYKDAIENFTNAIQVQPFNYFQISIALTFRARSRIELQDIDSALIDLDQAVRILPDNDETWYLMGKCYFARKDFRKAKELFLKAIDLNQANEKAYCSLGLCEVEFNNIENACNYFQLSVKHSSEEGHRHFLFHCTDQETRNKLFYPNGLIKFKFISDLNENKDTIYFLCHYDSSGIMSQKGIVDFKTKKYNGETKWYYSDSSLKKTGYLQDTIPYGIWKEYYPDGKIREEYSFSNGVLSGNYRFYYPEGSVQTERFYNNGKLKNVFYCRDKKGNPMNYGSFSGGSGTLFIFDGNEKIVQKRIYKEGVREENTSFGEVQAEQANDVIHQQVEH